MDGNLLQRAALAGLLLLAVLLPYEAKQPLVVWGVVNFTNLELLLLFTLGAGLLSLWSHGRLWPANVPRTWRWLWVALALGVVLAAWQAPAERINAFKAALRTIEGLALAVVVAHLAPTWRTGRLVGAALLAGALGVVVIGLVESAAGSPLALLDPLRQAPTAVGPFWRLSATFDHANQTAMYLEATLPLLLAGTLAAWRRQRWLGILAGAWLLLHIEATLLTYSRTAFATIFLTGVVVAALVAWRRIPAHRHARPWLALSALLTALVIANAALNPIFRLRLTSEGDNEWYRVGYEVPDTLALATGRHYDIPITLVNDGRLVWQDSGLRPTVINGRWESPQSTRVYNVRWSLPHPIAPGESVQMSLPLDTPNSSGTYTLTWDLVQENVVWFSQKNGQQPRTAVVVSGPPLAASAPGSYIELSATDSAERPVGSVAPPIPDRRTLWRIAWDQWRERPWLGIGLDNFRLTYGRYLGYTIWNDSIHTNNWYIETLVSLGVVAAAPYFLWLVTLAIFIYRRLRNPALALGLVGVSAGLVTFFIHGILDYFMLFNPTALLFWLLVGLSLAKVDPPSVSRGTDE